MREIKSINHDNQRANYSLIFGIEILIIFIKNIIEVMFIKVHKIIN